MRWHSFVLGILALFSMTTTAGSDVRNVSWSEIFDAHHSACAGRLTSLREERGPGRDVVVVAVVELTAPVAGQCPDTFVIRSSAIWEVLERPDRLGAEYLLFLGTSTTDPKGMPVYATSHKLAWERHLGWDCWGKSFHYYSPSYVNFPDGLRSRRCVRQALPFGGSLQHEEDVILEERLFSELKNLAVRQ